MQGTHGGYGHDLIGQGFLVGPRFAQITDSLEGTVLQPFIGVHCERFIPDCGHICRGHSKSARPIPQNRSVLFGWHQMGLRFQDPYLGVKDSGMMENLPLPT